MGNPARTIAAEAFRAAYQGDIDTLRRLAASPGAFAPDERCGISPLMCAAYRGHAECAAFLLPFFDPNERDDDGRSALILAAAGGHAQICQTLAPLCGLDARDAGGRTALSWACGRRRAQCAKALLALGADPDLPDEAKTSPLMFCAVRDAWDCAELLLPFCDACASDSGGLTALDHAKMRGHAKTEAAIRNYLKSLDERCKIAGACNASAPPGDGSNGKSGSDGRL